MDQNNKIRPIFPKKAILNRKTACQSLLKYNYKSFTTLKIDVQTDFDDEKTMNKIAQSYFLKFASKFKTLQKLNLESSGDFGSIKRALFIKIAKSFFKVKHLSIPLFLQSSLTLGPAIAWLKAIRNLSSFSSNEFIGEIYLRSQRFQGLFNMFNKALRKHQLKSLQITSEQDFLQHPTLRRLSSLQQLILSYNQHRRCRTFYQKPGTYSKVFPKLVHLKHLEITDPIKASVAAHILDFIPHPENIKSLGFRLYHTLLTDYTSCSQFKWSLQRFQNLKHFKLNFDVDDPFFLIIEPLKQCHLLEKLELRFDIKSGSKIIDQLATFICHFPQLINLRLKLFLLPDSSVEAYETQIIFLIKQISNLQKLEFLDLILSNQNGPLLEVSNEVILAYYQTVNKLKHLKKFDLKGLKRNFTQEFTPFMQTLSQKCLNFAKIELNLWDANLERSDLVTFLDVLKKAQNLETLHLRGLSLKDEVIWKKLFKVLTNATNLKKVYLEGTMFQINKQLLIDLFKSLLTKKGLKTLSFFYKIKVLTGGSTSELIDITEIIKTNLSLTQLDMGGILYDKIISNRNPFDKIKWDS